MGPSKPKSLHELPALAGGVPPGARRPGFLRWSWPALFLGGSCSLLVHVLLYGMLLAVPFNPFFVQADADVLVLALLATCVVAALGVYAVRADRGRRDGVSGWAMASAVLTFAAMLSGGIASLHSAVWMGSPAMDEMRGLYAFCFVSFGLALVTGVWSVVRFVSPRGGSRGWVLAAWGIVMPLWYGGFLWHLVVFPLFARGPNEVEQSLPEVRNATVDVEWPGVFRPVLRVTGDGRVLARDRVLHDPAASDDLEGLREHLSDQARLMPGKGMDESRPIADDNPPVPDNPILILADEKVDFTRIVQVMRVFQEEDVRIWKIELGVRRSRAPWLGKYSLYLPKDPYLHTHPPAREAHLQVAATIEGGERVVRYSCHGRAFTNLRELREWSGVHEDALLIGDTPSGVTWGDVAPALDAFQEESWYDHTFLADVSPLRESD